MKIFFTDCFDSIQLLDKLSSPLTTFDRKSLYPFTFVKSCLDLRVGILTLREKWQKLALEFDVHYITAHSNEEGVIWLSENVIPSVVLLQAIQRLGAGEVLVWGGYVVACCYTHMGSYRVQEFDTSVDLLKGVEDL
ncbi:MAG: putative sugar nucleotidyl transferase, partial [Sphingobacterium sp.]